MRARAWRGRKGHAAAPELDRSTRQGRREGWGAGRFGNRAQIWVRGSQACRVASPCPELTCGGREAEHDHSGDRAILQDRPRLQNLCVEGEDSGPCPSPQPHPHPGPRPCRHLDSAGPRGLHGHNRSDSRELRVAGMCQGGCGRQARGRWWASRWTEKLEALAGSQPMFHLPQEQLGPPWSPGTPTAA